MTLGVSQCLSAAVIASEDFDGSALNVSGSPTPTVFPSNDDHFGIVNSSVNHRFHDNSLADPSDDFGILNSAKTDNVFGIQDLDNNCLFLT